MSSPSTSEATASEPFVGEGTVPATAYQLRPWTASSFLVTIVMLLGGGGFLWFGLVESSPVSVGATILGALLALLSLVALSTRLGVEIGYGRARRAGHDFVQRFEISDSGVQHGWRKPDGTSVERQYDWFLFSSYLVEPHRLILYLRVPSAGSGARMEVLLVPAVLFGDEFAAVCALVARHVKQAPVPVARAADPNARVKTLVLWLVLVALFGAVYFLAGRSRP